MNASAIALAVHTERVSAPFVCFCGEVSRLLRTVYIFSSCNRAISAFLVQNIIHARLWVSRGFLARVVRVELDGILRSVDMIKYRQTRQKFRLVSSPPSISQILLYHTGAFLLFVGDRKRHEFVPTNGTERVFRKGTPLPPSLPDSP